MEEKATPKTKTAKVAKPAVKKATAAAKPKAAKPKEVTAKKVAAKPAAPVAKDGQMVRIRVAAYENKVLDQSVKQIVDTAMRHDAKIRGPVPLPTEIKKYTVNRSSFIDKNSREQFEMRIHRRLIDILNPSSKIVESLTNLNLPSGVSVDVKMV
jgi:small subunit ribosomal protein S10